MTARGHARQKLLLVIWSLLVIAMLAAPGDQEAEPSPWDRLDKPAHALIFAIHCGLLAGVLGRSQGGASHLAAAALGSGLFAVLMEAVQLWIPGRAWEWWDLIAGFAGIGGALLFLKRRHARLRATF